MVARQVRPFDAHAVAGEMLGPCYEDICKKRQPLVLFCAGTSGKILKNFLHSIGIKVDAFADNNPALTGRTYCGLPVISALELKRHYSRAIILIASAGYHRFVKKQLLELDIDPARILTLDGQARSIDGKLRRERLLMLARNGEPADLMTEYTSQKDMLADVYNMFEDDRSKSLYICRLAMMASSYEYEVYKKFLETYSEPVLAHGLENPERFNHGGIHGYFQNDVLGLSQGEVYLDAGAYDGDSAQTFIDVCRARGISYDAIHCFEADPQNFERLQGWAGDKDKVYCYPKGLWRKAGQVRFASSGIAESFGARIQGDGHQGGVADVIIDTVSIDHVFKDQTVTLIKMDIEGAEIAALQGAEMLIRRDRPKLAISVYHAPDDLYRIPALLKNMNPDYKMYLRHLGNHYDDTILYAI